MDNGPELISKLLESWAKAQHIELSAFSLANVATAPR
jgi:hypothetical protein